MKKYKKLIHIIISTLLFLLSYLLKDYKILFLIASYIIISYELYINMIKELWKKDIFNENLLMIMATIGAFIIESYEEAVIVVLLFQIGEYLFDLSIDRSKCKIMSLLDLKSNTVNLKIEEEIKKVDIKEVKEEDIFIVKPGEKIPLDGIVLEGSSSIDTSQLTGESIPKMVEKDSEVLSGFINIDSILTIKATTVYENSTAYKIIDFIENSSEKKAKTEKFITKFSRIYTPIIVIAAFLLVWIPVVVFKENFHESLYRSLVFLVTSCPCALVISVPLAYFCGVGKASKHGILVKGSNILEELTLIENIAFDKTGTLTEGIFEVVEIKSQKGKKQELLKLAAAAEYFSNHPIAQAIVKKYGKKIDSRRVHNYQEISGFGICCKIDSKEVIIGNEALMKKNNIEVEKIESLGSICYVAVNSKLLGYITISDKIKKNAKKTVESLEKIGIKEIIILSGDHKSSVEYVAKKLQIKNYIAELLPIDKAKKIEELRKKGMTLFVGDGMNDALVMKNSDVSISMGQSGSDVAIEVSDIVMMADDLEKVPQLIKIAKIVKKTAFINILFALMTKFLVLFLAILNIPSIWFAVFADVGVTLLTILNSLWIFSKKIPKS